MNSKVLKIDNCIITKTQNNTLSITPIPLLEKRNKLPINFKEIKYNTRKEANSVISQLASSDKFIELFDRL